MSDSELSRLIASVYDAAVEHEQWPVALDRVACLLGAMHSHLWQGDARQRLRSVGWSGAAPGFVRAYEEHYVKTDPFALARTWPSGTILTDAMMTPRAALERSDFFQDWARPQGMHTAVGANIALDDGNVAVLVATRRQCDGPFEQAQLDLLARVLPHLQRAMKINLRLYGMSVGQYAANAALDALNHAVLIVDSTARIIFANRIAEQILAAADGIGSGPLGLTAATATLTNKLQALVRQATGVGATTPVGGSLALNRPSMKRPYQVLIAPLRPDTGSGKLASPRPAALIIIVDPERAADSMERRLRALYNLTHTEARVACEIHNGASLNAVAESLAVLPSTVRTHLHHVFAKTETQRQADLVRLVEQASVIAADT